MPGEMAEVREKYLVRERKDWEKMRGDVAPLEDIAGRTLFHNLQAPAGAVSYSAANLVSSGVTVQGDSVGD